ncbi:MAG: magnesium/cobalt efflux protein [Gammaproteobacteria bacterium]|nr:magnesium/cobalt efflux protein [Gammaproteobacteria bacterium]
MTNLDIDSLFFILIVLLFLSAFFSGSETSLMSVNRYKLKHKNQEGDRSAKRVLYLVNNPDKTLGLILLLNNFVNILASAISTIIAIRIFGDAGIAISAGILTFVILVFSEVTPKTFAALYPDKIAYPVSLFFYPALKLFYPIVSIINLFSKLLLALFGVKDKKNTFELLTKDEIKTIIKESSYKIPKFYEEMIVNLLDLEKVKVEDAMIPRNEMFSVDITNEINIITKNILDCKHTRVPVYENDLNNLKGFLHKRKVIEILKDGEITKDKILNNLNAAYFIPEDTSLLSQLITFKKEKKRIGCVVDEYGDVKGIVTLDDILEEIVGEFDTTDKEIEIQKISEESYLIDGSVHIREMNRILDWNLPESSAKTINGFILEYLENIPTQGASFQIENYSFEIINIKNNFVKNVKITKK